MKKQYTLVVHVHYSWKHQMEMIKSISSTAERQFVPSEEVTPFWNFMSFATVFGWHLMAVQTPRFWNWREHVFYISSKM